MEQTTNIRLFGEKENSLQALNREFTNKEEFVKEFVEFCRKIKKENETQKSHRTDFLRIKPVICGESWEFKAYFGSNSVQTEATLFLKETSKTISYPRTTWGEPYKRWDTDLKEFLMREIDKKD